MISLLPSKVDSSITQFFANNAQRLRVLAEKNNAQRTLLNDLGLVHTNGRTLSTLFDSPAIEQRLETNLLNTLFEAIKNRDNKEIKRISKQHPSVLESAKKEIRSGKHEGLGTIEEIFARAFKSNSFYDHNDASSLKFLKDTVQLKELGGLYGLSNPITAYSKALELALNLDYGTPVLEFILKNIPKELERKTFIDLVEKLLAKILTRDRELNLVFDSNYEKFSTTYYNLEKIELLCKKIHELRKIELGTNDPDAKLSIAATDWLRIKEFGPIAKWNKWNLQNRYVFNDGISDHFSTNCPTRKRLISILRAYAPDSLQISYDKLLVS